MDLTVRSFLIKDILDCGKTRRKITHTHTERERERERYVDASTLI